MTVAENVYNAYMARKNSKSWAEWVEKNPAAAHLLNEAENL